MKSKHLSFAVAAVFLMTACDDSQSHITRIEADYQRRLAEIPGEVERTMIAEYGTDRNKWPKPVEPSTDCYEFFVNVPGLVGDSVTVC